MVYLHDTNKRGLFKYTRRAYSHGCIRVHKALDFAKHLLARFADIDEDEYKARLAKKKPSQAELKTHLPVYFEYMTADIHPEKGLVFYPDVYQFDYKYNRGIPTRVKRRFGDKRMRPKNVPLISKADYKALKKGGEKAPMEWPLVDTANETPVSETPQ